MNEKIAQLAEQAAQESALLENDTNLEVSFDDTTFYIPATFIEKFSELIVQECLTVVKLAHSEGNGDAYSYDDALDHVEYNMKQHFGVE